MKVGDSSFFTETMTAPEELAAQIAALGETPRSRQPQEIRTARGRPSPRKETHVIDIDAVPIEAAQYILQLRKEAAKMRVQRNAARRDANAAIARIAALHAKLAEMKAQLDVQPGV